MASSNAYMLVYRAVDGWEERQPAGSAAELPAAVASKLEALLTEHRTSADSYVQRRDEMVAQVETRKQVRGGKGAHGGGGDDDRR